MEWKEKGRRIAVFLAGQLQQPSTAGGVTALGTVVLRQWKPQYADIIATVGMIVGGILMVLLQEGGG